MPADVATLERKSGLSDLGLKASDLVAAIRSPYGEEARRVKDALAEKAEAEKALTPEMRKALARLEDAANPKSIEELKLDRARRDPTRIEDAQTRKEREETIRKLEAGEKLEDVRDLQDAVGKAQDAAATGKREDGKAADPTGAALDTIQLLAAGAEATETAGEAAAKSGEGLPASGEVPAETTGEAVRNLDAAGSAELAEREAAKKEIFALRVDDNGIYDLITRQLAGP